MVLNQNQYLFSNKETNLNDVFFFILDIEYTMSRLKSSIGYVISVLNRINFNFGTYIEILNHLHCFL